MRGIGKKAILDVFAELTQIQLVMQKRVQATPASASLLKGQPFRMVQVSSDKPGTARRGLPALPIQGNSDQFKPLPRGGEWEVRSWEGSGRDAPTDPRDAGCYTVAG